MIDTLTQHALPIATATGVITVADQSNTITNAIIATVVYVVQRLLLKLWDKIQSKKQPTA